MDHVKIDVEDAAEDSLRFRTSGTCAAMYMYSTSSCTVLVAAQAGGEAGPFLSTSAPVIVVVAATGATAGAGAAKGCLRAAGYAAAWLAAQNVSHPRFRLAQTHRIQCIARDNLGRSFRQ